MSDPIYNAFLARQLEEGQRLAASSDLFSLITPEPVSGQSAAHFLLEFRCKGLARQAGRVVENSLWHIGVFFPENYLRTAVKVWEVLSYWGPAPEPWHPNIGIGAPSLICMHLTPGASLVEITLGLYDLLTWNLFATGDEGLNHAAAQWSRHQDPKRFPVDRRPLKRRTVTLDVQPLTTGGQP